MIPGQEVDFTVWMADRLVYLTVNLAAAWMYQTRASTLGRYYAFRAVGVDFHSVGTYG